MDIVDRIVEEWDKKAGDMLDGELLHSLAQGATRYNLSKVNFLKLDIPLPELNEQTAIATVLSDMDAEISALEARREKTRQVKQGMMQGLLTGRTRLVAGGSSA